MPFLYLRHPRKRGRSPTAQRQAVPSRDNAVACTPAASRKGSGAAGAVTRTAGPGPWDPPIGPLPHGTAHPSGILVIDRTV
ncbi:hypothetical protein GCM10010295_23220 [Streptomyces intermedius]